MGHEREPFPPSHEASLESQHSAHPRHRVWHGAPHPRLHIVHQVRQSDEGSARRIVSRKLTTATLGAIYGATVHLSRQSQVFCTLGDNVATTSVRARHFCRVEVALASIQKRRNTACAAPKSMEGQHTDLPRMEDE